MNKKNKQQQSKLIGEKEELRKQLAQMRTPKRVSWYASKKLHMKPIRSDQVKKLVL